MILSCRSVVSSGDSSTVSYMRPPYNLNSGAKPEGSQDGCNGPGVRLRNPSPLQNMVTLKISDPFSRSVDTFYLNILKKK